MQQHAERGGTKSMVSYVMKQCLFSTSLLGKRQNLSSADLQPIGSLINGHMTERYCALKVN